MWDEALEEKLQNLMNKRASEHLSALCEPSGTACWHNREYRAAALSVTGRMGVGDKGNREKILGVFEDGLLEWYSVPRRSLRRSFRPRTTLPLQVTKSLVAMAHLFAE